MPPRPLRLTAPATFVRVTLAWAGSLVLSPPPARADHCAPLTVTPAADDLHLGARLDFETARYARPLVAGSWSGLATEVSGGWDRWQGRAAIGAYQLDHNGVIEGGLGDAGLELRLAALRRNRDGPVPAVVGPLLTVTLPTGDASGGFGMGHAMAMPGLWWSLPGDRLRAGGVVAYGRALADPEGHHHGTGPILDPMNMSELLASAGVDIGLAWQLRGLLTATYAHPLVDDGAARGTGGVGLQWAGDRLRVSATVQLPLVGDAFQVRTVIGAGVQL